RWWRIDFDGRDGWVYGGLVNAVNADGVDVITDVAVPTFDPATVDLGLETVFTGLTLPVFLTHAGDGSGRLFLIEKPGRIYVAADTGSNPTLFLDITDRVGSGGNEQGLLGMAFAPDYAESGYFYVNYTDRGGDTTVSRFQVTDDPDEADPDSESVVLTVAQPARNHNAGMLAFGPDDMLWIGLGDGGAANDQFRNGQNAQTMLGSMLRVDVSDPGVAYTVPADNPYVNDDDVLDEIWAIGLRNPWRYSFDAETGDFWIADVGQNQYEEVNLVPADTVAQGGLNFGWPVVEGLHCFTSDGCDQSDYFAPVHEYSHTGNGCSVTGGYVYRGEDFPELDGVYFFADYCTGYLWASWQGDDGERQMERVFETGLTVSSFGEDQDGELYIIDYNGEIHRLIVE
ncbi:MAG: PQQ-dependent sugar dehydrogenase, partial [Caldilineaceae bacterium]|nr:PQQ-dependent sugar dehydrogenase [Caldilineaceae bacterium]